MIGELFDLSGDIAIVTGATGHLGYAIAEGLAEHGAGVVLTSRELSKSVTAAKKIANKTGSKCIGLSLDIDSRQSIKNAFEQTVKEMGAFNILVNNAAYSTMSSFETMTDEQWTKGLDGTVTSVFKVSQEAIPYLCNSDRHNKVIINIASMYGIVSPDPGIYGDSGYNNPANYGAGKAAIIQLTKYTACHLASLNIRVNAISPGPFPNEIIQKNEKFIENLKEKTPLKRIGSPTDIKGCVVFLASSASSYVTGHNLVVDGGWTIW